MGSVEKLAGLGRHDLTVKKPEVVHFSVDESTITIALADHDVLHFFRPFRRLPGQMIGDDLKLKWIPI